MKDLQLSNLPTDPSDTDDAPIIIGCRERIRLPDWGVRSIRAKVDTGARSSAIDVSHLEELPGNRVAFDVAVSRKDRSRIIHVVAPILRRTIVRSSLGDPHDRLIVQTTMIIGTVRKQIEVGLVQRDQMLCRMLLGRLALDDFLVNAAARYLQPIPRRRTPNTPHANDSGSSHS